MYLLMQGVAAQTYAPKPFEIESSVYRDVRHRLKQKIISQQCLPRPLCTGIMRLHLSVHTVPVYLHVPGHAQFTRPVANGQRPPTYPPSARGPSCTCSHFSYHGLAEVLVGFGSESAIRASTADVPYSRFQI